MKNQFYASYCSPVEVVCFKQMKSCLLTEKRYAIYLYMTVPPSAHEVKAMLGLFCLYWNM